MEQKTREAKQYLDREQDVQRSAFLRKLRSADNKEQRRTNFIIANRGSFALDDNAMHDAIDQYYHLSNDQSISDWHVVVSIPDRSGICLDLDIRYKKTLFSSDANPTELTREFAIEYLKEYMNQAGKIAKIPESILHCTAFIMLRSKMESVILNVKDTKEEAWKHGAHIYFNDISFSRHVKVAVHEALLRNIDDTNLGAMLREKSIGEIDKILDGSPLTGSVTMPRSHAPGRVLYLDDCVVNFKVRQTNKGFVLGDITWQPHVLTQELFHKILPTVEKGRIDSKSDIDGLEEHITITPELVDDIVGDAETILRTNAEEDNPKALFIIDLLKLLPPEKYARSHDERLWITNCVTHETDIEWAHNILMWYYNLVEPLEESATYNRSAHILDRIEQSYAAGQLSGLGKLKKVAISHAPEQAKETIAKNEVNLVEDIIMNGFRLRKQASGRPTNTAAGRVLYCLVGKNYNVRHINGRGMAAFEFYHYDENAPIGPIYKKWYKLKAPTIRMEIDITNIVLPQVRKLRYEYSNRLKELDENEIVRRKIITAKLEYTKETEAALEDTVYKAKLFSEFTTLVAIHSNKNKFAVNLNRNRFLTGVYNGILEFKWTKLYTCNKCHKAMCETCCDSASHRCHDNSKVYHDDTRYYNVTTGVERCQKCDVEVAKFVLHDSDDNRNLFVSKSLGGCWRPELTENSPNVRELIRICRDIMPDEQIFEHRFVTRGGAFFAKGGGTTLEGNFGTGADGKTALSNCELAAGGFIEGIADDEIMGYAVQHSPLIWQESKDSANAHDAGYMFLEFMRYAMSAEPKESKPYIDGQALKFVLSDMAMHLRAPHAPTGKFVRCVAYCVIQINIALTFKNMNEGNIRRFVLIENGTKFYDETTAHLYKGLKNARKANEEVKWKMTNSKDMHEAMIWMWGQGAKKFAVDYNCQITHVKLPDSVKRITQQMQVASDIFHKFRISKLQEHSKGKIPIDDLIDNFRAWKQLIDATKDSRSDSMSDILHRISTSFLARNIVNMNNESLTAMQIISTDPKDMVLIGYKYKLAGLDKDDDDIAYTGTAPTGTAPTGTAPTGADKDIDESKSIDTGLTNTAPTGASTNDDDLSSHC